MRGRKVGVLVTDGADDGVLDALRSAVEKEGAAFAIVAPKIGGVKTAKGKRVAADHALSSGPSIFFDAVALVVSAKGAELLVREAAAIDWVRDAFGHLKVIGTVEAAGPILAKAAVEEDAGVVDLAGRGGVKIFIEAARRQRVWEREPTLRTPGLSAVAGTGGRRDRRAVKSRCRRSNSTPAGREPRRRRAIRSTGIACCRPATPPHLSLRVPSLARDSPRHAVCRPERRLHHGTRMAEPGKSPRDDSTVPPMPQPGGIAARARAAAGAPYLNDLNPEQRLAVETLDGPVLVLAGAGTGKTRVLTTRIAHILATGRARPSEILAVTFTNKAAREMKLRVGTMVGQIVEGMPWLGTFHSIGVKIIRRHAELVGLKPDFTILDVDDQIRLLKQLLAAEGIDEKRWPARVLAGLIDSWKNRGLTPDQVPAGEAASFAGGKGKKLYVAFQERLKVLNAADFGDLLLECIRLFREQPEVLRQYQARFRYILVDEYQDTNVAQYLWLRLLGQSTRPAPSTAAPFRRQSGYPPAARGLKAASPESIAPGRR